MEERMGRTMVRMGLAVVTAALAIPMGTAAQVNPLGIEVRGGLNWAIGDLKDGLGDINQDGLDVAQAEQHGWTLSGDVFWTFHNRGALFAGYNWAKFDCKDEECGSDGFLWSHGPGVGFKISLMPDRSFLPWARIGATAHKAIWEEGDVREESNRTLGVDLGVGADIPVGGRLRIVPAVRFFRYNAAWDVGSVGDERVERSIGWFQTDLGLHLHLGG
jgi:hypothetical protein